MTEMIQLTAAHDSFAFDALHAQPAGKRRGGVIVIQEIFGLDKYVREDVARWAGLGFEAVAPSMYDRQERGFTAEHDPGGMQVAVKYAMANGHRLDPSVVLPDGRFGRLLKAQLGEACSREGGVRSLESWLRVALLGGGRKRVPNACVAGMKPDHTMLPETDTVPWLDRARRNVKPAGSMSVTTTPVAAVWKLVFWTTNR